MNVKQSVRAASTAPVVVTYTATAGPTGRGQITAAPNVLDGVALRPRDRVLLKDQTDRSQNGVWVVTTLGFGAGGAWDRATDFDADVETGDWVFVEYGTVNDSAMWMLTTNNPIVIGRTALVWTPLGGIATAGTGLTKTDKHHIEVAEPSRPSLEDVAAAVAELATMATELAPKA